MGWTRLSVRPTITSSPTPDGQSAPPTPHPNRRTGTPARCPNPPRTLRTNTAPTLPQNRNGQECPFYGGGCENEVFDFIDEPLSCRLLPGPPTKAKHGLPESRYDTVDPAN